MDFKMPCLSTFLIKKIILLVLSSFFVVDFLEAQAQKNCSPSDPFGDNTDNLCPVHYHGIYGDSFTRNGVGDKAYYGPELGPNTPGVKIIDKRLTNDYFTRIEVGGVQGGITVKTNSGKTYTIKIENTNRN
jgi:hypothetical protein